MATLASSPQRQEPAARRQKNRSPGWRPGLFWYREYSPAQAAGLNSFDALALIGSAVSVAIFWLNSASSLVCAVKVSNCFLACALHSSIASEGDFTPISPCAKSRFAVVVAFMISISLAEYSLAPLLTVEITAWTVPLWVSATSLNLA